MNYRLIQPLYQGSVFVCVKTSAIHGGSGAELGCAIRVSPGNAGA